MADVARLIASRDTETAMLDFPGKWDAYHDFARLADGVSIDASSFDMIGNRYQAAANAFTVTGGIAWMGGKNNAAVGTGYMALKPGPVTEVMTEFVLDNPGGADADADSAAYAVVLTNDELVTQLQNLLHPYVTRKGWALQYRNDGTGGPPTTVASGTWQTPLKADGVTKHTFGFRVYPDTGYVAIEWPGIDAATGLNYRVQAASVFQRAMGTLVYFQENRSSAALMKTGIARVAIRANTPKSQKVEYVTASRTLTPAFRYTLFRPSSAGQVLTMPEAKFCNGHERTITIPGGWGNTGDVAGAFSDGATSKTIAAGTALRLLADAVNNVWFIV